MTANAWAWPAESIQPTDPARLRYSAGQVIGNRLGTISYASLLFKCYLKACQLLSPSTNTALNGSVVVCQKHTPRDMVARLCARCAACWRVRALQLHSRLRARCAESRAHHNAASTDSGVTVTNSADTAMVVCQRCWESPMKSVIGLHCAFSHRQPPAARTTSLAKVFDGKSHDVFHGNPRQVLRMAAADSALK